MSGRVAGSIFFLLAEPKRCRGLIEVTLELLKPRFGFLEKIHDKKNESLCIGVVVEGEQVELVNEESNVGNLQLSPHGRSSMGREITFCTSTAPL